MDLSNIDWQQALTAIAGFVTLLLTIGNRKLKKILSETRKNGGSTMKDQLDRIESSITNLTLWVEASQHLTSKPMFKTDPKGKFVWVNTAFARMLGAGLEDLQGMGWINYIDLTDVQRVSEEWESAIKDNRKFETVFKIIRSYNSSPKQVKARAFPVLSKDSTIGYLGTWITIEEILD